MGWLAGPVVLVALVTSSSASAQTAVQGSPRVRGSSPAIAEAIEQAAGRSPTFNQLLVDTLAWHPIVTPDGTQLIYSVHNTSGNNDVMQLALDGSKRVSALVSTPFNEGSAEVSPDGRWLAYQSDSSGLREVYVSPYPQIGEPPMAGVDCRRRIPAMGT